MNVRVADPSLVGPMLTCLESIARRVKRVEAAPAEFVARNGSGAQLRTAGDRISALKPGEAVLLYGDKDPADFLARTAPNAFFQITRKGRSGWIVERIF